MPCANHHVEFTIAEPGTAIHHSRTLPDGDPFAKRVPPIGRPITLAALAPATHMPVERPLPVCAIVITVCPVSIRRLESGFMKISRNIDRIDLSFLECSLREKDLVG